MNSTLGHKLQLSPGDQGVVPIPLPWGTCLEAVQTDSAVRDDSSRTKCNLGVIAYAHVFLAHRSDDAAQW